jgi:hypothetical protein
MASPTETRQARQVLAELELTSVTRARAYVPAVSSSAPSSRPPTGGESPARYWRERFDAAGAGELPALVAAARAELRAIQRRQFPVTPVRDGDDLRERIISDGEGFAPLPVAIALRTSEAIVRRTRVTAGRDAERGKVIELNGTGSRIDRAVELAVLGSMSVRAAAAATGVAKSTLSDHLRRARST